MNALGVLQLVLLAGLGFGFASGLVVAAVTPAVLGLAGLFAALLPSMLSLRWPAHDHCLAHHGHVHLCFLHPPAHAATPISWLLLALAAAWLVTRALRATVGLVRAARIASRLLDHRYDDARLGAQVLPTATPLCLLVGVVRPAVVVSEGLLSRVPPADLAVMLHHERAHALRRDTGLRLLARAATVLVWRPARTRLLHALTLAAEQSCDEVAGRALGDRLRVAEVILRVERILQTPPGLANVAASFGGDVPARVAALLEPPREPGTLTRPLALVAFAAFGLLAASDPLHHATESLLGALTH